MPPHKSKSTSITCGEGQQNGADDSPPLRLLLLGRLRRFVGCGSAFYLSRQRHGAGMNQKRLHRHATAAVCGSCASTKKPCRTKNPAPAFSLPHTTLSQSQAWSLCVLFIVPAHPACQAARGRAALLLSRASCHAPIRPKWLPKRQIRVVMMLHPIREHDKVPPCE